MSNRVIREEEGSSLILIIFAGLIGLVVIIGTVAVTSLYIERKRLFTVADGAALVSAEAFKLDDVQVIDGQAHIALSDSAVMEQASHYLSIIPEQDSRGVQIVSARTPDGVSSEVVLRKTWHPPVVSMLMPSGIDITVSAIARTVLG
jgi:hypothetical protein